MWRQRYLGVISPTGCLAFISLPRTYTYLLRHTTCRPRHLLSALYKKSQHSYSVLIIHFVACFLAFFFVCLTIIIQATSLRSCLLMLRTDKNWYPLSHYYCYSHNIKRYDYELLHSQRLPPYDYIVPAQSTSLICADS